MLVACSSAFFHEALQNQAAGVQDADVLRLQVQQLQQENEVCCTPACRLVCLHSAASNALKISGLKLKLSGLKLKLSGLKLKLSGLKLKLSGLKLKFRGCAKKIIG